MTINKTFFTVINILRPIIANQYFGIFGLPLNIYHNIRLICSKRLQVVYNKTKHKYDICGNIEELCYFFTNVYAYKYDLGRGFFDADNSKAEFFTSFGDCEDVALYAKHKLKEFGYKDVKRIFMVEKDDFSSSHVDCLYRDNEGNYFLFDYGKPIYGISVEECMKQLCDRWYARNKFDNVIYITLGKYW